MAGIAAGGPGVAPAYPATYVGVAPEAFIIMVKHVDVTGPVMYKNGGGEVSPTFSTRTP